MRWIMDPCVQFRAGNPNQAAGHVQPDSVIVVFHRPMDLIAGQTVLLCQRRNVPILDAAETSFGRSPQPAIRSET